MPFQNKRAVYDCVLQVWVLKSERSIQDVWRARLGPRAVKYPDLLYRLAQLLMIAISLRLQTAKYFEAPPLGWVYITLGDMSAMQSAFSDHSRVIYTQAVIQWVIVTTVVETEGKKDVLRLYFSSTSHPVFSQFVFFCETTFLQILKVREDRSFGIQKVPDGALSWAGIIIHRWRLLITRNRGCDNAILLPE